MVFPDVWAGLVGLPGADPASRVRIDIEQAAAKIVVEQPEGSFDAGLVMGAVLSAVEECLIRQNELRAVFLWVRGGPKRSGPSFPPLPIWAGGKAADVTCDGDRPLPAHALRAFQAALELLPQPVVGLSDGCINSFGTNLLAACDFVIATKHAELTFMQDTPMCAHAALSGLTLGAESARKLGFVSSIAATTATMLDDCSKLHIQLALCPPESLTWVKQRMRDARVALVGPASLAPDPGPMATFAAQPMPQMSQVPQVPQVPQVQVPSGRRSSSSTESDASAVMSGMAGVVSAPPGLHPPTDSSDSSEAREPGKPRRGGPKKTDLVSVYSAYDGPITSLMICNIPCRITQEQLIDAVDAMGFTEKYDFLYLPTGCRSSGSTTIASSNLGYGFVNFISSGEAARFSEAFRDFHFKGSRSAKVCTVRPAHIQGLANNILHFGRSTGKNKSRSLLVQPVVKVSREALVRLKELGIGGFEQVHPSPQAVTSKTEEEQPLQIERLQL